MAEVELFRVQHFRQNLKRFRDAGAGPVGIGLAAEPIPSIIKKGDQHQLIVNGRPFLLLGAQVHNSSGWSSGLDSIWKQARQLHANTLEIPIYWEEIEPQPGQYRFETIDALVKLGLQPRVPVNPTDFVNRSVREGWIRDRGMQVFSMFDPSNPMRVVGELVITQAMLSEQINHNLLPLRADLDHKAEVISNELRQLRLSLEHPRSPATRRGPPGCSSATTFTSPPTRRS